MSPELQELFRVVVQLAPEAREKYLADHSIDAGTRRMPSKTERGVIKPLASSALPLIAWRLRDVSQPSSRVVMEGTHSCANCHSASRDGRTMGMDLDGPRNDKGLYAIFRIQPRASITKANVVAWSNYRGKLGGKLRVGFMSQVSPAGDYVVTTINDTGPDRSDYQRRINQKDFTSNYYVANFKDYRFLQVFYPTRGILAWYSRATGRLQPIAGADDPRFVHTNAVWSPDGNSWSSRALLLAIPINLETNWQREPTTPTRRRFSTTCIASRSTTAKAAWPNR